MSAGLRLISTDFDGTLIGHPSDGRCVRALGEALLAFKESGGLWAVNTGRSLEHTVEGVAHFAAPVEPDFLLTEEREIYRRDAGGQWSAFGDWNARAREAHAALFLRSAGLLDQIRGRLGARADVTLVEEDGQPAGLVTTSVDVMESVVEFLDAARSALPEFSYQRNLIYLRFCHRDYHKGAALGELTRLLGLGPDAVFAVGDNFNDLSMLDLRYARHVGCPVNAIAEVKEQVARFGGRVAAAACGEGVAEILRALIYETPPPAHSRGRRQDNLEMVG